jgi:hypothetical protein
LPGLVGDHQNKKKEDKVIVMTIIVVEGDFVLLFLLFPLAWIVRSIKWTIVSRKRIINDK